MSFQHFDDIDERDLSEAPRLVKVRHSFGTRIGAALLAALVVGLLIYGSLPELSPGEIVSMDDYQGEQPTRYTINIHGLREEAETPLVPEIKTTHTVATAAQQDASKPALTEVVEPLSDVLVPSVTDAKDSPVTKPAELPLDVEQQNELPVSTTETVPATVVTPVAEAEKTTLVTVNEIALTAKQGFDNPESTNVAEPVSQALPTTDTKISDSAVTTLPEFVEKSEVPIADTEAVVTVTVTPVAVNETPAPLVFGAVRENKVVAATASTPTIEEAADTVIVASVVAPEPLPLPVSSTILPDATVASNADTSESLPLRSVRDDATEVKASPSVDSETVLSLDRGDLVTAFEQQGEWVLVGTNDSSVATGFVQASALQTIDTKPSG